MKNICLIKKSGLKHVLNKLDFVIVIQVVINTDGFDFLDDIQLGFDLILNFVSIILFRGDIL